ncbi:uncharacterized protein LOC126680059 [Mercurialis annua]|uniref:uncharacterized protein LOC126680059 n=1 Tax=Mercurialis annua TaxID=3986 RepID=UPI002160E056|nr:uncharacterized protein LOC126680059 [Mercurialis annua]
MDSVTFFREGDIVEVIEQGFFGTLYKSRIENKVGDDMWEVMCLCREDANGRQLILNLPTSVIRPFSPEIIDYESLSVNHIVDAHNMENGAHHCGVITTVQTNSHGAQSFVVRLSNNTLIESSYVRRHCDYFHQPCFVFYRQNIGTMVEIQNRRYEEATDVVEIEEDGTYSAARIVRRNPRNYRIEYSTRYFDPVSKTRFRVVPKSMVRPSPPVLRDRLFIINDDVDAYMEDRWYRATLRGFTRGTNGNTLFTVDLCDRQFRGHSDQIRFHSDWLAAPSPFFPGLSRNGRLPALTIYNKPHN